MSPVTLDLVTKYVTIYVNKEQLGNLATGAQYAGPVKPGQFSVRGLRTAWITVLHKLPQTKNQIFGCPP